MKVVQLSREGVFFQNPMNSLMRKGTPLAQYDPQELEMQYIQLARNGGVPSDEQVDQVRERVISFCAKVHGGNTEDLQKDIAGIDEIWPEMRERFKGSLSLTQMMLNYGADSRYFYEYLYLTGRNLCAVSLEAKDGRAIPVSAGNLKSGNFAFERVPESDWFILICVEEPSFAARRATDGVFQTVLREADSIFEAGAGLLPAYRNYGYPLGQLRQRIVACDSDPRMLDFLPLAFGKPLTECGIEYVIGDLMEVMARPEYRGQFKVVRMTGILSYFPDPAERRKIMRLARGLLKPGGLILTDDWVLGMSLVRSSLTTLWPLDPNDPHPLTPAKSAEEAVAGMNEICRELELPYIYIKDFCNGNSYCWTQEYATTMCMMYMVGEEMSVEKIDVIRGAALPGVCSY